LELLVLLINISGPPFSLQQATPDPEKPSAKNLLLTSEFTLSFR
jgi:hypothetical protein